MAESDASSLPPPKPPLARCARPARASGTFLRHLAPVLTVGSGFAMLIGFGWYPSFYYMIDWLLIGPFAVIALPIVIDACLKRRRRRLGKGTPLRTRGDLPTGLWAGLSLALLLAWQTRAPMRLAFLFSKPQLESRLLVEGPTLSPTLADNIKFGPYEIDVVWTRQKLGYQDTEPARYLKLILADDIESGFVYARDPAAMGGFLYNSGNRGHLIGPWYWFTED